MQPVKVPATQIFHHFNKLACPYSNLPKTMKGSEIKKIPNADSVLPLLQLGKVTNKDLRFNDEAYHLLMGLWSDMLAHQFLSVTGLSGLT
eukprot:1752729-Ditylum_brightwellii.AAC.1